ncbi:MAG: alpha/beta hydrolase [Nitrospiraceae bacterium]|nr:MAG: alpha/beta hydrolase [Nitrospiraceae bacterium]
MVMLPFIVVFMVYLLVSVSLYYRQDSMIFYPEKEIWQTPKHIGLDYEEISLTTNDGVVINAWYVPAKNEKGVVLFCHGNAGNISHRLDSIKVFHDLGQSVLIFDYRGYGKSGGKISEKGTYLDAEAAWDYLVQVKHRSPGEIVIFGRSLGAAVAAETALRKNPGGLILESTFMSISAIGRKYYPWLPVNFIARYRYATVDKIDLIKCPKLIIHSKTDEIIPFEHGLKLYEKAAPPKEFLEIRGGHNEGFMLSGAEYSEGLRKFLDAIGKPVISASE